MSEEKVTEEKVYPIEQLEEEILDLVGDFQVKRQEVNGLKVYYYESDVSLRLDKTAKVCSLLRFTIAGQTRRQACEEFLKQIKEHRAKYNKYIQAWEEIKQQ